MGLYPERVRLLEGTALGRLHDIFGVLLIAEDRIGGSKDAP